MAGIKFDIEYEYEVISGLSKGWKQELNLVNALLYMFYFTFKKSVLTTNPLSVSFFFIKYFYFIYNLIYFNFSISINSYIHIYTSFH